MFTRDIDFGKKDFIKTNLRKGTLLPSQSSYKDSPFIFDYIFLKNTKLGLYENSNGASIKDFGERTYRFLVNGSANLDFHIKSLDLKKISLPMIWLYDNENKLIAKASYASDNSKAAIKVPKAGFYKLKIRFDYSKLKSLSLFASLLDSKYKSEDELIKSYVLESLKTIELNFDPIQMSKLEEIRHSQREKWNTKPSKYTTWASHNSSKDRVVVRVRTPGSKWAIASLGIAGRSKVHDEGTILPSIDIKVASGELPYGMKKFKLYSMNSKSNSRDMTFESILRDNGLFFARQDLVKVVINNEQVVFMELLERVDSALFEYGQRVASPVLGYDTDSLISKVDNNKFMQRNFLKKLKYSDSKISSRNFTQRLCRDSFLAATSFAMAYAGNHGLNQTDLRFHDNWRKNCFDPMVRDFNSGVEKIMPTNPKVVHTSMRNLSTLVPEWRPNVTSFASVYMLKNSTDFAREGFFWWSVMPATMTFLAETFNVESFINYMKLWDNPLEKQRVVNRFRNLLKVSSVLSKEEKTFPLSSVEAAVSLNMSNLFTGLIKNYKIIENYTLPKNSSYLQEIIYQVSKKRVAPEQHSLAMLNWRNSTVNSLADYYTQNIKRPLFLGANVDKLSSLIMFLYRKENQDSSDLVYIERKPSGAKGFLSGRFFLHNIVDQSDIAPSNIIELGTLDIPVSKRSLYLNEVTPGEKLRAYYFRVPKKDSYQYFEPKVSGSLYYMGVREIAITPKEITKSRVESENLMKFFRISGNQLSLKNNLPVVEKKLFIPPGYTWIIDESKVIRFSENGCLEVYADLDIQEDKSIKLEPDKDYWSGIHFHNQHNLKLKNFFISSIGNGEEFVKCGDRRYSGAVSFYNVRADIDNLQIKDSQIEDALHFLRSEISIRGSLVEGSMSDALDSDFSELEISKTTLTKNLGDGLDVSGSLVNVDDCDFIYNEDKNFSIGENTLAYISESRLNGGKFGIAVKDASNLEARNCEIEDNNVGIAIYNKKPFYRAPQIQYTKVKFDSNNINYKNLGFLPNSTK